ncbi:TRAP-type C4-dicarboxylate transport system, small permease component [Dethiosulfatibacter aminovorans DSM 17477]|uniref:TRAP-type C4-dicarboxylate transport system, small permease component n=2 Tax=Dethiosulfatibacter TaxID=448125 RepID=A0A1M6GK80_9FIRM|nr:TRAP-type C4-dicarboxylate transport system, small permease component [Dethiosulfatibacter aminovorans DSM 17477]
MKKLIYLCESVLNRFINFLKTITGYAIFLFMALLFFQVCMRFIFNHPIYGIDEMVTFFMIWTMSMGWCTVYWDNEHAVLEFVMKKMPHLFQRIMYNVTNLIVVIISIIYIPGSKKLFDMQMKMTPVGGLDFSKAYYYALPVLVMSIIMLVLSIYKTIAYLVTGDDKLVAPVQEEVLALLELDESRTRKEKERGGDNDDEWNS